MNTYPYKYTVFIAITALWASSLGALDYDLNISNKHFLWHSEIGQTKSTVDASEAIKNPLQSSQITKVKTVSELSYFYRINRNQDSKVASVESAPLLASINTFRIEGLDEGNGDKDAELKLTKESSELSPKLHKILKDSAPDKQKTAAVLEGSYFNIYTVELDSKIAPKLGAQKGAVPYTQIFANSAELQTFIKLDQIKIISGLEYIVVQGPGEIIEAIDYKISDDVEKKCHSQQSTALTKALEENTEFTNLLMNKVGVVKVVNRLIVESEEAEKASKDAYRIEPLSKAISMTEDTLQVTGVYYKTTKSCDCFTQDDFKIAFGRLVESYNR